MRKEHQRADGRGLRFNVDKDRWDLLPTDAVEQVVKVLTAGAKKYKARNWERGMAWSICQASMARHTAKWAMGARRDSESGLPHMAHVACNALFLLAYELRSMEKQDDVEPMLRTARRELEGSFVWRASDKISELQENLLKERFVQPVFMVGGKVKASGKIGAAKGKRV